MFASSCKQGISEQTRYGLTLNCSSSDNSDNQAVNRSKSMNRACLLSFCLFVRVVSDTRDIIPSVKPSYLVTFVRITHCFLQTLPVTPGLLCMGSS